MSSGAGVLSRFCAKIVTCQLTVYSASRADVFSKFMLEMIVEFPFIFSPSVPLFSVKFCWKRPSSAHEPCQIHHHLSPSVNPSIAPILPKLSLIHTHNTHVDSLLLYLWLPPLHHQSCHCCQSICEKHPLHVTNGCTCAFAVCGVTHECHPFCKVNHLNFRFC